MSGLPPSVVTIRAEIRERLGTGRCFTWRRSADESLGVLAYDVCGLKHGDAGPHQSGWSGTGQMWDQPHQDPSPGEFGHLS
jgi:hypothetical protein